MRPAPPGMHAAGPTGRAAQRHDLTTVPGRAFAGIRHLMSARASLPHLDGRVGGRAGAVAVRPGVLAVLRRHPLGPLLEPFDTTAGWRPFPGWRLTEYGLIGARDALSGHDILPGADGNVWLHPYGVLWLFQG